MWLLATFIAGVCASYAAGRYTQSLVARDRTRAVLWDTALVALNSLPALALWAGNSLGAVAVWVIANGIGTWLVLRPRVTNPLGAQTMAGMFICNHCGIESQDHGAEGAWFHEPNRKTRNFDLCPKCRGNWEEDGPRDKDERYVRVCSEQCECGKPNAPGANWCKTCRGYAAAEGRA